jgi:DNA mismatch repair ATPase MutS
MYRDHDFDLQQALPVNEPALTQDLDLSRFFTVMAGPDEFLFQVARQAIFSGLQNDTETILYRQAVLKDCSRNRAIVHSLYTIADEVIRDKDRLWWSATGKLVDSVLYGAVRSMNLFIEALRNLRRIADEHSGKFESEGFKAFFAMLQAELTDEYLMEIETHLKKMEFRHGVLLSVELGKGNQGKNYVLRQPARKSGWIEQVFTRLPSAFTFHVDPRDEAGQKALRDLRNRGMNLVANALAQSADHILSFISMLRTELAFYLACDNLRLWLEHRDVPVCFPVPAAAGAGKHACAGLRDVSLALNTKQTVIGNDLQAEGKRLCVITGANGGGKSTFLRAVGLAQLMMQCGMFVAAKSFNADICRGLFTHFKREEDPTMKSGKLDEELSRMSVIVDALTSDSLLLFNESFAATNEREGSEIAGQIVLALLQTRVKIFYVTHLYEFAHRIGKDNMDRVLFLRAQRQADGQRTFKLLPGKPLETSFAADLYEAIFGGG